MRKKIGLFLGAEPSYGGAFQYNQAMLDAVASFPKDTFSICVAHASDCWNDYLHAYELDQLRIPRDFWRRALCYGLLRLGMPVAAWRRLCKAIHPVPRSLLSRQCDLWIFPTHDGWSYLVPVPALVTVHDLMHRYEGHFPEVSARGEFSRREKEITRIAQWARGILVDSEVGRQQMMESYHQNGERIHVLPYIAPKHMYAAAGPPGFDARYQLPEKFIFYPAQFWQHKNHAGLIGAIAKLKHDLADLKLVLVGSKKNAYDSVVRLVKELDLGDDIIFLGYVHDEDMPELYRRARALVMPTFFGPTNIPPLEAFIAGCPVAISGIYGIPEQVGDAALLFDPQSVDEIAHSIRKLWTDDSLCSALAAKGKKRAALWGQQQFAERLRMIIERMLGGGSGKRRGDASGSVDSTQDGRCSEESR